MARLDDKPIPGDWSFSTDTDYFARTSEQLEALREKSKNVDLKTTIVGVVVNFPIADGYAWYVVSKERPLTLQHIPFCDAWQITPAHLRGLGKSDIVDMETRARVFAELFSEEK